MKSNKTRRIEKWEIIIEKLKIDVSKPVNFVTANHIKSIIHEEPRLMAKMDRYDNLPQIFKENNLFLLPISRKEYTIIKGNGYHKLETIDKMVELHLTSKPFPESAIGIESESVFLDYANSCGLLEKLCQTNNFFDHGNKIFYQVYNPLTKISFIFSYYFFIKTVYELYHMLICILFIFTNIIIKLTIALAIIKH